MKKAIGIFVLLLTTLSPRSWAIPLSITYQGSLKEKGASKTSMKTMVFRITNSLGKEYWSSGDMLVSVANGLFSVALSPTGVDWENVVPYIEVSVEGQQLSPREPVNTTVYAKVSQTVVDGSITRQKLDPALQDVLTPSGVIVAFVGTTAPNGWLLCDGSSVSRTTYANLFLSLGITWGGGNGSTTFNLPDFRGRMLIQKSTSGTFSTIGTTGGTETHSHQLNTVGTHNTGNFVGTVIIGPGGQLGAAQAGPDFASTGATIYTNSASNLPPYAVVNYIIKI